MQIDMASHLVVLTRFAAVFVVRKWRGNGRGRGQGCSGASVSWMGSGGACRLKKVVGLGSRGLRWRGACGRLVGWSVRTLGEGVGRRLDRL